MPNHRALGTQRWKDIRKAVLARDGYTCGYCGRDANTVDHIIPRAKGGDMWSLDNLISACGKCNAYKSDKVDFLVSDSTPPAFMGSSLPDTRSKVLLSPFSAPIAGD